MYGFISSGIRGRIIVYSLSDLVSIGAVARFPEEKRTKIVVVDAHTHIFPADVRDRRERFFDREPDFRLIYENPKSSMASAEELIRSMDTDGVDVSVVFGFPWRDPDTAKRHNDYVLEAVSRYPDRLWGLACAYPLAPGAASEFERALDAGMNGIGELALYVEEGVDDLYEAMADVADLVRDRRVPLLLHCNETVGHEYPGKADMRMKTIYRFVKQMPDTPVVLAHWGGGLFFFELMKREVAEVMRNVYYDTAASPFLYRPDVYDTAVRICGEDKVLFGSDYPLLPPSRYFKELRESGLDETRLNKIRGENAARVFGR